MSAPHPMAGPGQLLWQRLEHEDAAARTLKLPPGPAPGRARGVWALRLRELGQGNPTAQESLRHADECCWLLAHLAQPLVRRCARHVQGRWNTSIDDGFRIEDLEHEGLLAAFEAALRWNGQGDFATAARSRVLHAQRKFARLLAGPVALPEREIRTLRALAELEHRSRSLHGRGATLGEAAELVPAQGALLLDGLARLRIEPEAPPAELATQPDLAAARLSRRAWLAFKRLSASEQDLLGRYLGLAPFQRTPLRELAGLYGCSKSEVGRRVNRLQQDLRQELIE